MVDIERRYPDVRGSRVSEFIAASNIDDEGDDSRGQAGTGQLTG
jgi:hypothetical protein